MKNSLEEYNKKRDFSQTKEPEGHLDITGKFRFVIQKHAASRLHYDFRIEHDGVLKSWAVPKGPPYSSSEKHLAMAVEDHPISYFDFEGVIPEGNYGAGKVIVWDWGNYWVPHAENEKEVTEKLSEGFEKGEIKLILNGEKVKGMFALVRFKKAGENGWLMIKDKDEYEGKDFTKKEKSVKSGMTLEQVGKSIPHQVGNDNKKLEFIPPMKATLGDEPFDNPNYIFEEKLDGYRVIAVVDEDVQLYSRTGESMNRKFPEIAEALDKLKTRCILDGEVVAYDKKGKASFQMVQNAGERNGLVYNVFDVLNLNGINTLQLPLLERKKFLKAVLSTLKKVPALSGNDKAAVKLANYVVGKGKKLFKDTLKLHEGIIAKKADSKYLPGERTADWIKIKNTLREEFVIGGVTKPKGNRKEFGSLIVGYFKKDKLIHVGHIGTGFNEKMMQTLMKSFKKIERKTSPFENYNGENQPVLFWVEPIIICEAEFAEWTRDRMIRQASFVGIRTDKLPKQVDQSDSVLETILTNPDKVYFPDKKYTKLDLAKYYFEISSFILPYLKDRPQNLNRHPEGIQGFHFYQKDIEFDLPDYVDTYDYKRDKPKKDEETGKLDREITYILCQNLETLIFMSNLGCIEINPWISRISDLEHPDYLVFDIDPAGVDFEIVVKVARNLYNFLEDLDIRPFIKTSGKRGIHLYMYLANKYTHEESRNFAEIIAKIFEAKYPEYVSLERSPKDRKNKIYIDYLQNRIGQTTAAVYSARPTEVASVSTPITVSNLTSKLDPKSFDIKNTLKRLEKVGDLWEEIWESEIDLVQSLNLLKKSQNA